MTTALKIHPLARFFPAIEGEEFDQLVVDIRTHGLIEPITLCDGMILDGRNRARACAKAGVKARFVTFTENGHGTALDFVVSKNIRRRHLTVGQRAFLAVKALPELEKQAAARQEEARKRATASAAQVHQGPSAPHGLGKRHLRGGRRGEIQREQSRAASAAARLFEVGRKAVQQAKAIQERAPAVAEQVIAGKLSLAEAQREAVKSDKWIAKQIEREQAVKVKRVIEQPALVKEYLAACHVYRAALKKALIAAREKFFRAPETRTFTKRLHTQVKGDMDRLEGAFDA